MIKSQKVYETGLLLPHYASTAYPLTPQSFLQWKERDPERIRALLEKEWSEAESFCLYLHVPFCRTRCRFCEYVVLENPTQEEQAEYAEDLAKEMRMYAPLLRGKSAVGFDIGGGTPLLLSAELLTRIVETAKECFEIDPDALWSIETTPQIAAAEPEKLRAARELGFRRVSMGIQTVSARLMAELGREGKERVHAAAMRNIRKAGFEKCNVDLMYGFLKQSDKDLESTLEYAMSLKPNQITMYRNLYKGTRLEEEAGGVSLYKGARQYRLAWRILTENGWNANVGRNTFAREAGDWGTSDYLTRRVIDGTPYLGLGLGAQSFGPHYLSYDEGAATRSMADYREKLAAGEFPLQDVYALPPEECMAKMTSVAFYFGFIDLERFRKRFGVGLEETFPEEVRFVLERGLMERADGKLILTPRGADYVNGIVPLFYSERSKEELARLLENRKEPESEGEKRFLASYRIEDFDRPSVATDVVAMTLRTEDPGDYRRSERRTLAVLLIRRGEHPFLNRWALPGGFLRRGESVEHCAQRELFEEAGLNTDALQALGCFSAPGRDPRGWIVSNAFLSVVGKDDRALMPGDDAMDARWFDFGFEERGDALHLSFACGGTLLRAELGIRCDAFGTRSFEIRSSDLAFDHAKIVATALSALQSDCGLRSLAFAFLPSEFTIAELQRMHELLTGRPELAANFRRKILPRLQPTGRIAGGEGHRPARIYERRTTEPEEE